MFVFFRRIIRVYVESFGRMRYPLVYSDDFRYSVWLAEHRPTEEGPQC